MPGLNGFRRFISLATVPLVCLVAGWLLLGSRLAVAEETHFEADPRLSGSAQARAIVAVLDQFLEAFVRGDVAAIEKIFWHDAVVYPSNDRDRIGWNDIQGYWAPAFKSFDLQLKADILGLTWQSNLAVLEVVTHAVVTSKTAPADIRQHKYRDMIVLRRDSQGGWRIFRNLSQAYPAAKPAAAAPAAVSPSAAATASFKQEMQQFLQRYLAAYESGDIDELRPFYGDESLIWANGRATVLSWARVRDMFAPAFDTYVIEAQVHLLEAENHGDTGFLRFLTEVRLKPKAAGETLALNFRDFAIVRRTAQGWAIVRNMDQPITAEQLRADLEFSAGRP